MATKKKSKKVKNKTRSWTFVMNEGEDLYEVQVERVNLLDALDLLVESGENLQDLYNVYSSNYPAPKVLK
jgi:hypothetical protein